MDRISYQFNEHAEACDAAWSEFCRNRIIERIWDRDFTVWGNTPDQISNRLGWLDCAHNYRKHIHELQAFASQVCNDGIKDVVLIGMGGSSLGAEVLAKVHGSAKCIRALTILDTTDPQAICDILDKLDFQHSLFIVSTKSGSTVETMSLFRYCFNRVGNAVGYDLAAQSFVAITDAGSQLDVTAKQLGFRKVFLNDPTIGGRYSVLSFFGLVPAALLGVDIEALLDGAEIMARIDSTSSDENTLGGAYLGVALGELANQGRDKLTVICSEQYASFGAWLEQLIAESSGKLGKGVLPVLEQSPSAPECYDSDRVFVVLDDGEKQQFDDETKRLAEAGFPVISISLHDNSSLGAEFFRWQIATACMCHVIGVNPFDQPDVESAKQATRRIVEANEVAAHTPTSGIVENGVSLFYNLDCNSISEAMRNLLPDDEKHGYIAVLAYMNPNQASKLLLAELCAALGNHTNASVAHGFGPRYLHSTGQLHKGGLAGGRFLIITIEHCNDLAIPNQPGDKNSSLTFGSLINAQALGDEVALIDAGRHVTRAHFNRSVDEGMQVLLDGLDVS